MPCRDRTGSGATAAFLFPRGKRAYDSVGPVFYLGSCVHDVDEPAVVIGFADGLKHVFILQTASAEAGQRLTAAAHG